MGDDRLCGRELSARLPDPKPLIDDVYHSDIDDYVRTLLAMREIDVSVVHSGHLPSFGRVRCRQLIDEYIECKRKSGCHLQK
jgi:hypothetical protein